MRNLIIVSGIIVAAAFAAGVACGGDDDDSGPVCPRDANCAGRVCGTEPTCMTSCGTCPTGQTCSAVGTCTTGTPTNEEGCLQTYTVLGEQWVRCSFYCASGEPITSVEAALLCMRARDICGTITDATAPMSGTVSSQLSTCVSQLPVAACADLDAGGAPPTSCTGLPWWM